VSRITSIAAGTVCIVIMSLKLVSWKRRCCE